ncbi:LCP family protein, partial [Rhodococcus sp. EPR-157]|uniref:LCP family protein n=1 Tax=Rhodococcus sp. EPR-157 TaxID=1813677 RepID=UPI0018D43FD4
MRGPQIIVASLAILVLVVTGFAWRSVDSLRSNIATAGGLGLGGGADGAVDILMVGTDSRTDAHGNALSQAELDSLRAGDEVASNTDTIVLIRVPNDGSSATAISIPRDSYVEVPGIGMSKINAAYGATKETRRLELVEQGVTDADAESQSTEAGREALIESVADLTGITVDHYAEVGLLGFVLLTDAVGGVDVCLNAPVDEPLSGANFPAGEQTLSGADALSFVRQRHDLPRGDLDRIVRQQVFMASLVRSVLSAKTLSNPSTLNQLSGAVQRSVVLDSDWDILEFATKLQDLAGGKVKFETIPAVDINGVTDYG